MTAQIFEAKRFMPVSGFEFDGDAKSEPPAMLVKHLLPFEGVSFIGGQSGAGKTFIAVQLAVCLASGEPFFGRKVRERVGVAILAGEGAATIGMRTEVARRFTLINHSPLPICWLGSVPNLSDSKEIDAMIPRLRMVDMRLKSEFKVRLGAVIFDTLAATFALEDENDNSEASKTTRQLRRLSEETKALMIPVHHYGKGAETGLRGASAWRANCDSVLSVLAERNQITGQVIRRELALAKSRVGEEGSISGFKLRYAQIGTDEDGESFGSCFVEQIALAEKSPIEPDKLTKSEKIAMNALCTLIEEGGEEIKDSDRIPKGVKTISVSKWRQHCYSAGISGSEEARARQKAFERASDKLRDAGRIDLWEERVWPVPANMANNEQPL